MGHWNLKHWRLGISSDAVAVQYNCMVQVQTVIRALGLTGIASASVVVKKLPLERVKKNDGLSFPVVMITPARSPLNPAAGDNVQDDVVYGILVTLMDADNQEPTLALNLPRNVLWLERTRRAFHCKRLPNVATVYTCAVEPAEPVLPQAWAQNLWASALLLKFTSREHR